MNPRGLCLHICSCQHPGHGICQHGPTYIQEPQGAVGANWLQSGYVSTQGRESRKGNFCIIRRGHLWTP